MLYGSGDVGDRMHSRRFIVRLSRSQQTNADIQQELFNSSPPRLPTTIMAVGSAGLAGRGLRGAAAVPRGQQGGLHGVGQRGGLHRVLLPGAHPEHQGQRRGGKGGRRALTGTTGGGVLVPLLALACHPRRGRMTPQIIYR